MLPPTPTQLYLVSIRFRHKISFVTTFTFSNWLKKYYYNSFCTCIQVEQILTAREASVHRARMMAEISSIFRHCKAITLNRLWLIFGIRTLIIFWLPISYDRALECTKILKVRNHTPSNTNLTFNILFHIKSNQR